MKRTHPTLTVVSDAPQPRFDKNGKDITLAIAKRKAKNPRPASGIPASDCAPAPGWGGPAKGEGMGYEEKPALYPDEIRARARVLPPHITDADKAAADFLATLYDLATDPAQPGGTRVNACSAGLDRLEGKPVQRTITATLDDIARLRDDDIRAELARLGGTGASAS